MGYSSDIEFDLDDATSKASKTAHLGARSIDSILACASDDRLSTKKKVKTLEFGTGSPVMIQRAYLWKNRFEAFRKSTLDQDLKTPFTGMDILRFLDAIIGE